jgi:hypothetical protein
MSTAGIVVRIGADKIRKGRWGGEELDPLGGKIGCSAEKSLSILEF